MSKRNKQSMTEDYLAQVEWDNNHPLDRRGRPSWRYQPKSKYRRVYRISGKGTPLLVEMIWCIAVTATLVFLLYQILGRYSGSSFFGGIAVLSILVTLYFFTRQPK